MDEPLSYDDMIISNENTNHRLGSTLAGCVMGKKCPRSELPQSVTLRQANARAAAFVFAFSNRILN